MAFKGNQNKMIQSGNYLGNIGRTKVRNHYTFRSTFNSGYLFPVFAQEIDPSMGQSINMAELIRSITPLGPTMDNSFLDIFFFFVPNRLLWDHWEEFIAGYNKEAWAQDHEYVEPQIKFKGSYCRTSDKAGDKDVDSFVHSFLDYLPGACDVTMLPEMADHYTNGAGTEESPYVTNEDGLQKLMGISALYPRAFVKIFNDWFRDENLQDELELYTGDNDEYADEFAFDLLDPAKLPKACKLHDRITSALPAPLKGPDVLIPMNNLQVGINATSVAGQDTIRGISLSEVTSIGKFTQTYVTPAAGDLGDAASSIGKMVANNVSNTIRMLRLATQTELLLARDARGGTRYTESILSHFKVHNGDARLQRSEYLGSRSIPLNIQQVTNTAQGEGSALGNVGAQSVTKDSAHYFTKSFSEWGIVLGLAVVRTAISYSSGVRKIYQRRNRFDHIWPEFKHIGDVPLYTREIVMNVNLVGDEDHVFGYTPYGSELRTGYNFNNGLFRPLATGSLSYLTYQEDYVSEDNPPYLSSSFIEQNPDIVSNTLIDQSGPQFYALFDIVEDLIIPLDPTSDPGLMDHF